MRRILTSSSRPPETSVMASNSAVSYGSQVPLLAQQRQSSRGAPSELSMDDLLGEHLSQRALRMFEAEEEEAMRSVHERNGSMSSPSIAAITSPQHVPRTHSAAREGSRPLPPVPHLHPRANRPRRRDPLDGLTRRDRSVRTTALAEVWAIMQDTTLDAKTAAIALKRVRGMCRESGVPFGELLEEEVESFGMIPLVIEIIRCDFQHGPELLLFLLENSLSKNLLWNVRRGCILRSDNGALYETLRQLIPSSSANPWDPPRFEYEISVAQMPGPSPFMALSPGASSKPDEFRLLISIPNFPKALIDDAQALAKRRTVPPEKRGEHYGGPSEAVLRPEAGLVVEWIACDRCWTLEFGSNRLELTLLEGEPCSVDARMTVIRDERPTLRKLDIEPIPGITKRSPSYPTASTLPSDFGTLVQVEPPTPQRMLPPILGTGTFYSDPQSAHSLSDFNRPLPEPPSPSTPPRPPRPPRPLLFPHTTLHPLQSKGQHKVVLAPCFPSYAQVTSFVRAVLGSQELLTELVVTIGPADAPPSPRPASVGGRSFFHGSDGGYDSDQSWEATGVRTQNASDDGPLVEGNAVAGPSNSSSHTLPLLNTRSASYNY